MVVEGAERPDGWAGCYYVGGDYDLLESISMGGIRKVDVRERRGLTYSPLCDSPTFITFSTHDEDTLILQAFIAVAICKLRKWCMGLYEHGSIEGYFEKLGKLLYTFLF